MDTTASIRPNENIIDVAIRVYGHINGLYFLVKKNNSISFSSELSAGTELIIDDSLDFSEEKTIDLTNIIEQAPQELSIESNQNIFDISIIAFGSVEGLQNLIKRNNISASEILLPGTILNSKGNISNKSIVDYWKNKKTKPATGNILLINNEPVLEGIGYWAIAIDFKVS